MLSRLLIVVVSAFMMGCQTSRDLELVRDRITKLQPLSEYKSTVCQITAEPTQPALARFEEMHKGEAGKLKSEDWNFKWRQWESRCEIAPSSAARTSPVLREEQQFLASSLCVLAQIFYVNSPFDELKYGPEDVHRSEDQVRIGPKKSDLGIYLDRKDFWVVTRTKTRGELKALYTNVDGQWLPAEMEQDLGETKLRLSEIQYADSVGGRRMVKSLLLSVGREQAFAHTRIRVQHCEPL